MDRPQPHRLDTECDRISPESVIGLGDVFCPGLSVDDWDSLCTHIGSTEQVCDGGAAPLPGQCLPPSPSSPSPSPVLAPKLSADCTEGKGIDSVSDLEKGEGVVAPLWKAVHRGPLHLHKLTSVDIAYHDLVPKEAGEVAASVSMVEDMCYVFAIRVETYHPGVSAILWCRLLQRSDTSEKGRSDNLRLLVAIPSLPDEGREDGVDPGTVVSRLSALGFSVRELPRVHVLRTPLNGGALRNLLRKWLGVY